MVRKFMWRWVVGVVALTTGGGVMYSALAQKPSATDPAVYEHAKALSKAFRNAAEVAMPAVVKIETRTTPKTVRATPRNRTGENPFKGTPFEDFFNQMPEGQFDFHGGGVPRGGIGSGVIIDKSGIILTNNHVVDGADEVTVHLNDGREFKGTDIKTDPQTDLAVVRIKSDSPLPAMKLGDSDKMDIGDWVIAIGSPFELQSTVSHGIISAKGRELATAKRAKFLQTDAAINPGNSGGPLINLDGEIVGINTAIATETGSFNGIGFAVPSNLAKWVTTQLIDKGSVQRAYLGVAIGEVTSDIAKRVGVKKGEGVLVNEVFTGSPAAEAGVQEGDVILSFNGQKVASPRDLQEVVERAPIGSKQPIEVLRDGKSKQLSMAAKALPKDFGVASRTRPAPQDSSNGDAFKAEKLGLSVSDMSEREASQLGFEGQTGVLVTDVDAKSPAAEKGIREGMLIRRVGNTPVKNIREFEAALKKENSKDGVMLLVRTQNGSRFVVLQE